MQDTEITTELELGFSVQWKALCDHYLFGYGVGGCNSFQ